MRLPIELGRVRDALQNATFRRLERQKRASVALVLSEHQARLSVLLVQRSERPGDPWSGHMALPGGYEQRGETEPLHTARRETLEEVGLDLLRAELLGRLDDVTPMRSSELAVTPFVFWSAEAGPLQLSSEIALALWVPLDDLARRSARRSLEVAVGGARLRVPAYPLGDRAVWGVTLRLLDDFLARVTREH